MLARTTVRFVDNNSRNSYASKEDIKVISPRIPFYTILFVLSCTAMVLYGAYVNPKFADELKKELNKPTKTIVIQDNRPYIPQADYHTISTTRRQNTAREVVIIEEESEEEDSSDTEVIVVT